jgi:hypothetical protein
MHLSNTLLALIDAAAKAGSAQAREDPEVVRLRDEIAGHVRELRKGWDPANLPPE